MILEFKTKKNKEISVRPHFFGFFFLSPLFSVTKQRGSSTKTKTVHGKDFARAIV